MIRHASSHGLAVLTCTISSALLVESIKPLMPKVFYYFSQISIEIIDFFKLNLTQDVFTIVLVASIFAMIWGIIFKLWIKD